MLVLCYRDTAYSALSESLALNGGMQGFVLCLSAVIGFRRMCCLFATRTLFRLVRFSCFSCCFFMERLGGVKDISE